MRAGSLPSGHNPSCITVAPFSQLFRFTALFLRFFEESTEITHLYPHTGQRTEYRETKKGGDLTSPPWGF
jgi:hypothetical protein